MRRSFRVLAVAALLLAGAALPARADSFRMAHGFTDELLIVSGQASFDEPAASTSAAFFHTTGVEVAGIDRVCWQPIAGSGIQCADGDPRILVHPGDSFGLSSPFSPFAVHAEAAHALATFIDLSTASGFDQRLRLGPSAIVSMQEGKVTIADIPAPPAGRVLGFASLDDASSLEVRTPSGVVLHATGPGEEPLLVTGAPRFASPFGANVMILPYGSDASATFSAAKAGLAKEGLSKENLNTLEDVLQGARFVPPEAKQDPLAVIRSGETLVSEVFNGAAVRTKLSDRPHGLTDVAFAKFQQLSVDGNPDSLELDGSYTLVVGEFGVSANQAYLGSAGSPVNWWIGLLVLTAICVTGAWFWLRDGKLQPITPGPEQWVARVATAVGFVALVVAWDWRLHGVLGSSMLTTQSHGATFGLLSAVELGTLVLAGLLVGVPVYFAVRYGFALARRPRLMTLGGTAAVFLTLAFGLLLLPSLAALLVRVAAG